VNSNDDFSKEEITKPIPHETLAEMSARWELERLTRSERPTIDFKKERP